MRKYLSILLLFCACSLSAANIYVQDNTGWSELYLYSYINDAQGLHGKWPGASPARTEVINGAVCPVWNFTPARAGEYFLIFNNGNGAQTKSDFLADELRDYYLVVTPQGCTEVSREDIQPDPDPEPIDANSIIIYEANERVFATSKAFNAIDARLDAMADLGVNVLWLMPIHPIGQKNSVGSPYCVRDYKGVHSSFGTLDDLKRLIADAHAKNMRVIIDWVANHTAWDHVWVTEHPDWYTEAQTSDERNWNDVTFLNYSKQEVREAMIDAMTYWVNQGIDGFRCDYAQGVPDDFWAAAIQAIRAINPNAIMLAETSRLQLFEAGFDWMYSWSYLSQIQKLLTGGTTLRDLYSAHDKEMSSTPEGKQRMRYITNHDACSEQANSYLYTNTDGMLAAACLTYFLGGIPLIYSSQEVGYLNQINFFSTNVMNWNSNLDYQAKFRQLMHAYQTTQTLRGGKQTRYTADADVACFTYSSTAGMLLVIANTKNASRTVAIPESLRGKTLTNMLTGAEQTLSDELSVPAFGYFVLSTEKMPSAIIPVQREAVYGEPVKRLINGQLVILRDGKIYNMMGACSYLAPVSTRSRCSLDRTLTVPE